MTKIVAIFAVLFLGISAQAKSIESFKCVAESRFSKDAKVFFETYVSSQNGETYLVIYDQHKPVGPIPIGPISAQINFHFNQFAETETDIYFGGSGYLNPHSGVRAEISKVTGMTRFCTFNSGSFVTANCTEEFTHDGMDQYRDVKGTGSCDIQWKQ